MTCSPSFPNLASANAVRPPATDGSVALAERCACPCGDLLALGTEGSSTGPLIAASCVRRDCMPVLTDTEPITAPTIFCSRRMRAPNGFPIACGTCNPHLAMHVLLHTSPFNTPASFETGTATTTTTTATLLLPCLHYPRSYTSAALCTLLINEPANRLNLSSIHAV